MINGTYTSVRTIKRTMRFADWGLSKVPMLCALGAYLCLTQAETSSAAAVKFLIFTFAFATSHSAFGYLINDLGDIEVDVRQGKRNTFADLGMATGLKVLGAVIVVMLLSGLPFVSNKGFSVLWVLCCLTAVNYSLPPLRLKERGLPGLAVSTIAQCLLPGLIACAALTPGAYAQCWLFIAVGTICGAVLELAHQRFDFDRDASTGTSTFAVRLGRERLDRLIDWALWMDRLALGGLLVWVVCTIPGVQWMGLPVNLVLGIPLIALYLAAFSNIAVRSLNGQQIDPYYGNRNLSDRFIHHILPGLALPAFLLCQLTAVNLFWSVALVMLLAWRFLLPAGETSPTAVADNRLPSSVI